MKEYKAVIYQENLLSSLVFGSAKINPVKFSEFPQQPRFARLEGRYHGKDQRRMLLFFVREAYVVILEKNVFKLGVYACLGLFVSWVLLLILQLWFPSSMPICFSKSP